MTCIDENWDDQARSLRHHHYVNTSSPLAIGGNRLTWQEVPLMLRAALEAAAGAPVAGAISKEGGFSPGLASVLELADGRSVFAKAASASRNEFTVEAIRRETRILAELPGDVPAPRLRWSFDDGEWVALVTEAIDGRNPVQPWRPQELDRFLVAAEILADQLTPSPIVAGSFSEDAGDYNSWTKLAGEPGAADRLDPRARGLVDRLAGLERSWSAATAGDALLHGDLRSDNFLLTPDGFVVVDWPFACIGAPWLDLLLSLPSVAMHGGGDPQALWAGHPLSRGVDPDAVDTVLAAASGFFLRRSLEPAPPLLPTIREFQKAQGMITLDWLCGRVGWA